MKTDRITDDGVWIVIKDGREAKFKDIVGGLAFGDPGEEGDYSQHGISVVGFDQSERCILLAERLGEFGDVGTEAINLKDQFLLSEIYCQPEPKDFRRRLEGLDGLTTYAVKGYRNGTPVYSQPGSIWLHFRDRKTTACLIPVSSEIMAEMDANISRVAALIGCGDVLMADWCPKTRGLDREGFSRGRNHPLLQALVFAVVSLTRKHQKGTPAPKGQVTSWYGNRL